MNNAIKAYLKKVNKDIALATNNCFRLHALEYYKRDTKFRNHCIKFSDEIIAHRENIIYGIILPLTRLSNVDSKLYSIIGLLECYSGMFEVGCVKCDREILALTQLIEEVVIFNNDNINAIKYFQNNILTDKSKKTSPVEAIYLNVLNTFLCKYELIHRKIWNSVYNNSAIVVDDSPDKFLNEVYRPYGMDDYYSSFSSDGYPILPYNDTTEF